jgi:hypothetical protein
MNFYQTFFESGNGLLFFSIGMFIYGAYLFTQDE